MGKIFDDVERTFDESARKENERYERFMRTLDAPHTQEFVDDLGDNFGGVRPVDFQLIEYIENSIEDELERIDDYVYDDWEVL